MTCLPRPANMLFYLLFILHSPSSQTELTAQYYEGELFRKEADGFSPIDDFKLVRFTDKTGRCVGHVMLQAGQDRAPWAESIAASSAAPRLWHNHDGVLYKLEPIAMQLGTDKLADRRGWRDGRKQFQLGEQTEFEGQACREVLVQQGPARNHKLLVDERTGNVLSLQQRVFMGRGDEFRMTLQRTKTPKAEQVGADIRFFTGLIDLRSVTSKAKGAESRLKTTSTALPGLRDAATTTWAKQFAKRIETETSSQTRRTQKLSDLRQQALGKPMPALELPLIAGGTISSRQLANQITVFHIWSYRDEPLAEPYGQTAYLDFVADKYAGKPVRFVGINVDARYADKSQVNKANRSARKLIEFMNLTYPIARDDGSFLNKIGDPRSTGTELPLWIVTDRAGNIRVWKTGYYAVDARAGLKELRATIDGLLK